VAPLRTDKVRRRVLQLRQEPAPCPQQPHVRHPAAGEGGRGGQNGREQVLHRPGPVVL